MTGIHRERPGAEAITAATGEPATELGEGIWMSPGLSNSYLVQTATGRVVVNAGMEFEGPLHRRSFDAVDASPTAAVILTQGHYDHVGGLQDLVAADSEIIAHANCAQWRADNERLGTFRTRNAAFAWMDAIAAALADAASRRVAQPDGAPTEPTTTFTERLDLTIGGRQFVLVSTPGGETTDALVIWLPDCATVLTGNLFGPLFGHVPNLVTMRGDRYRDALSYIESLHTVLAFGAHRLITGHFDPIEGRDCIASEIAAMSDAMQWVHDRTVDGMNAGADVYTLMRDIRLPEQFDLGEGYGKTSWNVRAIWENYAGWFHHRSTTELYAVPPATVASDVVAVAGAGPLVEQARGRLDAGEPVAALHLTDMVLAAEPTHAEARATATLATLALLDATSNFWERAWLRRSLDKLEAQA